MERDAECFRSLIGTIRFVPKHSSANYNGSTKEKVFIYQSGALRYSKQCL